MNIQSKSDYACIGGGKIMQAHPSYDSGRPVWPQVLPTGQVPLHPHGRCRSGLFHVQGQAGDQSDGSGRRLHHRHWRDPFGEISFPMLFSSLVNPKTFDIS